MRRLAAVVMVVCFLMPVGCGSSTVRGSYRPPFTPFKLIFDSNGRLAVELARDIVTPVGTFGLAVGLGQDVKPEPQSTLLYVYTYVDGELVANVYRINTSQTLGFAVEGKVYGQVSAGRMELKADPGVPTTIEVFDSSSGERPTGQPQPPYILLPPNWSFRLPDPLGTTAWVADIDSRKVDYGGAIGASEGDLRWEYGYGLFSLKKLGYAPSVMPTPEQCRDAARSNATGKIPADNLRKGQTFCVETDHYNVAWMQITGIEKNFRGDSDRAQLSLTAAVWIKSTK